MICGFCFLAQIWSPRRDLPSYVQFIPISILGGLIRYEHTMAQKLVEVGRIENFQHLLNYYNKLILVNPDTSTFMLAGYKVVDCELRYRPTPRITTNERVDVTNYPTYVDASDHIRFIDCDYVAEVVYKKRYISVPIGDLITNKLRSHDFVLV